MKKNVRRQLWTVILPVVAVGCGASVEGEWEEGALGTSGEALSGATGFGETAVAPVSVTGGVSTPIAFNSNDLRVRALAVVGSSVYVGGEFSFFVGAQKYTNLVKFQIPSTPTSPLTLDQAFHPSVDKPVWAIAADSTRVYAGGEFTTINSTSRAGLALLAASDGSLNTAFSANLDLATGSCTTSCGSEPPQNAAKGVHALALNGTQVIVGGNFTNIKGVNRSGLASVSATDGTVSPTAFSTGVAGFVTALRVVSSAVYVGGYFSVTVAGIAHSGLMVTNSTGAIQTTTFSVSNVIDLDFDTANSRVIAGTSGNVVQSFPTAGGSPTWSTSTQGDVQAVHFFDGNVYYGFHDGLFIDGNAAGKAGDQYKLAAVNATNGARLKDKVHAGSCAAATPDNCWAPDNDSKGKAFSAGTGGWGLWTIEHFTNSSGQSRLLVGGEVNKWGTGGTVDSKLLTSFAP